ncbi:PQ-loop domain-containing transporter [Paenibacillus terreus]|uniref:PQ-loop domain-containing transporter n=1 Tax=Paenibacillus terreus TaxID=1387834 RepID=A0ABV5B9X0_9BACL
MFFAVLQLIGGVILSFGWLPQIVQMIRTRSVKGLNVNTVREGIMTLEWA